jgi:hypothetical protein
MANVKKQEIGLDIAKLQQMTGPFTVNVQRTVGNAREPLTIPSPQTGAPEGTMWSAEAVVQLNTWIRDKFGAGYYHVEVTDSSQPAPQKLVWDPFFAAATSAMVPVAQQAAAQPTMYGQPQPQPMGPAVGVPAFGAMTPGFPPMATPIVQPGQIAGPWTAPQGPWAQTPPGWQPQWQPQWFGQGQPQGWGGARGFGDDKNDDRMRSLEQRLQDSEKDKIKAEYDARLERIQAEQTRAMEQLRAEIKTPHGEDAAIREARERADRAEREAERARNDAKFEKLQETIAAMAAAPKGPSPEIEAMRAQMANDREEAHRREDEHRRTNERLEAERREDRLRQEMKDAAARTEALFAANANKGPDPMLQFMMENSRLQADAMKENSRVLQMQMDKMSQYMTNPRELAAMLKDGNSGFDLFTRQMIPMLTGVVEIWKNVATQATEMSGNSPMPPAAEIIKETVVGAKDAAERYFAWKRYNSEAEANVKIADSQARIVEAQAAAARAGAPGYVVHPQPTPQPASPPQPPAGAAPTNGAAAPTNGKVVGRIAPKKPTDEDLFGPTLTSIKNLRTAVAEGKCDPSQAVDLILQGADKLAELKIMVPAYKLFIDKCYADFIDVLLPAASNDYKVECVRILIHDVVDDVAAAAPAAPKLPPAPAPPTPPTPASA